MYLSPTKRSSFPSAQSTAEAVHNPNGQPYHYPDPTPYSMTNPTANNSRASFMLDSNITKQAYSGDNTYISTASPTATCLPATPGKQICRLYKNKPIQPLPLDKQQFRHLALHQKENAVDPCISDPGLVSRNYELSLDQRPIEPAPVLKDIPKLGPSGHDTAVSSFCQPLHFADKSVDRSVDPTTYRQLQNGTSRVDSFMKTRTGLVSCCNTPAQSQSQPSTPKRVKAAKRTFYNLEKDNEIDQESLTDRQTPNTNYRDFHKIETSCEKMLGSVDRMRYSTISYQDTPVGNSLAKSPQQFDQPTFSYTPTNKTIRTPDTATVPIGDISYGFATSAAPGFSNTSHVSPTYNQGSARPTIKDNNLKQTVTFVDTASAHDQPFPKSRPSFQYTSVTTCLARRPDGQPRLGSTDANHDSTTPLNPLHRKTVTSYNGSTDPSLFAHSIASNTATPLAIDRPALKRPYQGHGPDAESRTNTEYPEAFAEMENFYECFPSLRESYKLLDKVGEGAFSTVYKAVDLCYDAYTNVWDNGYSENVYARHRKTDQHNRMMREIEEYRLYGTFPKGILKQVAIKRIHVTAHPRRIASELSFLKRLSGSPNLLPLITAARYEDQIIAVMPYFEHHDFRDFYDELSVAELRVYFKQLFSALAFVHAQDIIHRDVKAQNFLYNRSTHRGVLVDFGLAERVSSARKTRCECGTGGLSQYFPELDPCRKQGAGMPANKLTYLGRPDCAALRSRSTRSGSGLHAASSAAAAAATAAAVAQNCLATGRPVVQGGKPRNDTRHGRRFSRAGTRGFRAPEVLFGCPDQTVGIDVWSAGIMLLSFLTKRCVFFQARDDSRALIEMATVFGARRMGQTALLHGVVYETSIPTIPVNGYDLEALISWCRAAHIKFKDGKRRKTDSEQNKSSTHVCPAADRDTHKAIDFVKTCLELDFRDRTTAAAALQHPFLKNAKLDISIYGEEGREATDESCDPFDDYLNTEYAKMVEQVRQAGYNV